MPDDNSLLDKLIQEPQKNLEAKLITLENQLIERKELSDHFLTQLHTQKRELKELKQLRRYHPNDFDKQLAQLDVQIQKEELSRFHDVSYIIDRISLLQEEITLSSIKSTLISNES